MTVWRLKKGADRRLRQGHPWAFASELAHSPREIAPGELVELRDAQDHFLAYGYAHPSSQICFRKLSSHSRETDVMSAGFFKRRLLAARDLRRKAGWTGFSHRWLYAEADGVPGLIIDAFSVAGGGWTAVVQASTAGAERALPELYAALSELEPEWSLIEAGSSRARSLEGLAVTGKRVIRGEASTGAPTAIELADGLRLHCDLLRGQKTGFFLDQQWNAGLLKRLLTAEHAAAAPGRSRVRILDICCYVGQWAAHCSQALRQCGVDAEVTLLDASAAALELAERNLAPLAVQVHAIEADALAKVSELQPAAFDLVICDPPAFVKKKADLESGLRAYTKLNRDALKLVRPGGLYVASSCSGLVKPAEFARALAEAGLKSGRAFKHLIPGGHGPDHPVRPEFPEGEYLKCFIGRADPPF